MGGDRLLSKSLLMLLRTSVVMENCSLRMRMDLSKIRRLFREVLLVVVSPDYCLRIFFLCLCSQKMFSQDRLLSILSLLEGAPLPFWLLLLLLNG